MKIYMNIYIFIILLSVNWSLDFDQRMTICRKCNESFIHTGVIFSLLLYLIVNGNYCLSLVCIL